MSEISVLSRQPRINKQDLPIGTKPIPSAPNYWASKTGIIYSCLVQSSRGGRCGAMFIPSDTFKILNQANHSRGYSIVCLRGNGKAMYRYVHRLILETFVGPCPPGMECCHGDGNRKNNSIENLRWDTRKGNSGDKLKHGTDEFGEKNPFAKLTEREAIAIIQEHAAGINRRIIAKKYGVCKDHVSAIVSGKFWPKLAAFRAANKE